MRSIFSNKIVKQFKYYLNKLSLYEPSHNVQLSQLLIINANRNLSYSIFYFLAQVMQERFLI
jgi:hypothetical protein